MITLTKQQFEQLVDYATGKLPNEACGLIAGIKSGDKKVVAKIYFLPNEDLSPEHYTISPAEQLKAIKDMRANNLELLGNWHSHPDTPSRMSYEDIALAHDPKASYLILSLQNRQVPILHSFNVKQNNSQQEILIIEDK
jgi:proteasome lid subunit RPN8/RPN11